MIEVRRLIDELDVREAECIDSGRNAGAESERDAHCRKREQPEVDVHPSARPGMHEGERLVAKVERGLDEERINPPARDEPQGENNQQRPEENAEGGERRDIYRALESSNGSKQRAQGNRGVMTIHRAVT